MEIGEGLSSVGNWIGSVVGTLVRGSPENPSTNLSDPDQWLIDWFAQGSATSAGVNVTDKSALRLMAYYGCVRVLSESVAGLPLGLFERLDGGGSSEVLEHQLSSVVKAAANPLMSAYTWKETSQGHLATRGNAYSTIERNGAGQVVALWPQAPSTVQVRISEDRRTVVYDLQRGTQAQATLLPEDVIHVPGLGDDGLVGYAPVQLMAEAIGHGLAAQKHGAELFGSGAVPDGILTAERTLKADQQRLLLESWEQAHRNRRSTALLHGGLKYEAISITPEQAQFIESRKMTRSEIAGAFRVPPHMIGDLERATFSNIEHQDLAFVKHTLRPWLVRWEQELDRKLLSPMERRRLFFKFMVDDLLRGDVKGRAAFYKSAVLTGYMNRNEVRARENLNPAEGLNEFLVPMNMAGEDDEPEPEDQDERPGEQVEEEDDDERA